MQPCDKCPLCGAVVAVGGDRNECTRFYYCPACNKPVDPVPDNGDWNKVFAGHGPLLGGEVIES